MSAMTAVVDDDVTFANTATLGGHVQIGEGVIFGGLSAVQQFGRVGKGAMIGGVTGVNTDVIPYGMATGDHAELAGLNLIGLKRRGLSRGRPSIAMRAAFRAIFLEDKGSLFERARRAKEKWPAIVQVEEIVDFILADAKRGLCVADRSPHARGRRLMAGRALGIIAGGGELPRAIAESARDAGRDVFVLALRGSSEDWVANFRMSGWRSANPAKRSRRCMPAMSATCFSPAGSSGRNSPTSSWMPKACCCCRGSWRQRSKATMRSLRSVVELFEREGFHVVGVAEAAPGLIAEAGPLGRIRPSAEHESDIALAFKVVRALGALDVGQAAVVCDGLTPRRRSRRGHRRDDRAHCRTARAHSRHARQAARRAGQGARSRSRTARPTCRSSACKRCAMPPPSVLPASPSKRAVR